MADLHVRIPHPEGTLHAEVQTEGSMTYGGMPTWYVDAAWIVCPPGNKVRDLTDLEIEALDAGAHAAFTAAVGQAYADYDPTP